MIYNTHGSPFPPEEISATKVKLGLNPDKFFDLPSELLMILEVHTLILEKK